MAVFTAGPQSQGRVPFSTRILIEHTYDRLQCVLLLPISSLQRGENATQRVLASVGAFYGLQLIRGYNSCWCSTTVTALQDRTPQWERGPHGILSVDIP